MEAVETAKQLDALQAIESSGGSLIREIAKARGWISSALRRAIGLRLVDPERAKGALATLERSAMSIDRRLGTSLASRVGQSSLWTRIDALLRQQSSELTRLRTISEAAKELRALPAEATSAAGESITEWLGGWVHAREGAAGVVPLVREALRRGADVEELRALIRGSATATEAVEKLGGLKQLEPLFTRENLKVFWIGSKAEYHQAWRNKLIQFAVDRGGISEETAVTLRGLKQYPAAHELMQARGKVFAAGELEKLAAGSARAAEGAAHVTRTATTMKHLGRGLMVMATAMAARRFYQALKEEPRSGERIAKEGIHTLSQATGIGGLLAVPIIGTAVDLAWGHSLNRRAGQGSDERSSGREADVAIDARETDPLSS